MIEGHDVDVSSYQGHIDWGAVVASGAQFAVVKSSEGTFLDPYAVENCTKARQAKLPALGTYHFFRADVDLTDQVNEWYNTITMLRPDFTVLDVEQGGNDTLSAKYIFDTIRVRIQGPCPTCGAKPHLWVYCNDYYASSGKLNLDQLRVHRWLANPDQDPGFDWEMWQYSFSGSVPGIGGNVDVDRYRFDLWQLLNGPVPQPPPVTEKYFWEENMVILINTYNPANNAGTGQFLFDPTNKKLVPMNSTLPPLNMPQLHINDNDFNALRKAYGV